MTWIQVRSDHEADEVSERSRQIVGEMASMPGFIGFVGARTGHRLSTMAAWEDPDSPKQLLRGGAHKDAMERFFGLDFAAAAMTSVWVPQRINGVWIRCESCGRTSQSEKVEGRCPCGAALPEHPPYW